MTYTDELSNDPNPNLNDPGQVEYTVYQVAAEIEASYGYQAGETVQLWACWTGSNGFAQKLATLLGAPVIAPVGDLQMSSDGSYAITPTDASVFPQADGLPQTPVGLAIGATPAGSGWEKFTPLVQL